MSKRNKRPKEKKLKQYQHKGKKRINNPPVGLVNPQTDRDAPKKEYKYDPHLDPQLAWAGKAEHTSFKIPTVSLHVHERIDPHTIIDTVRKKNDNGAQQSLFSLIEENPPLREAIEFYKHSHNWSNRLIAGDSLLVMNSLLEKEGMAEKVQMIYMDPPYGIKYGSNFQPFVNKRDVKDGKDEDLTAEPETIKAFRDTWELGIHSYLTYMRDRLLLAKKLLHESGSIFVQISDKNNHHVRELLDETFGSNNFCGQIAFQKSGKSVNTSIPSIIDYLLWYSKDKKKLKVRMLYKNKMNNPKLINYYDQDDGDGRKYRLSPINSQDYSEKRTISVEYKGKKYHPGKNRHWSIDPNLIPGLLDQKVLTIKGNSIFFKMYLEMSPVVVLNNFWDDTSRGSFGESSIYVVQTTTKPIERCILITTDPGDLVLDPTCGSGTTAYVAEQWGRRWITCDTSRVSIALAKQRLMTALFDYYKLAHPIEGVGSGFVYKKVPHITLKSLANNEPPAEETLYDQPYVDNSKARITGPFTNEAVPSPTAKGLNEIESDKASDISVSRSGETLRQSEWRDEILNNGVRGKGGQYIKFIRVEPMSGTRYIQAEAETKPQDGEERNKVFIVFGPEHALMEQRQVGLALDEAQSLRPKADIILFAAFQFDPEAAKDIDETNWPGVKLLRVQMNSDLLTDDLKKKGSSSDSFWLLGQPDVNVKKIEDGENKEKYQIEVKGFDYYNTKTGDVTSGSEKNIAMWMLDPDYDGRSLFPRQVFFPMSSNKDGWSKLSKNLKADIDQELIEAYRGTVSLPFSAGENKQCAIKIIDDRGIESLRILKL